jgi:hypothetical protein
MSTGTERAARAVDAGVAFLTRMQLPGGEFPTLRWPLADAENTNDDPTVFSSTLIAQAVVNVPGTAAIVARLADDIARQMLRFGIWNYSGGGFSPDVDDTSMASVALRLAGRTVPDNQYALLANRNGRGLFFTWISPRPRWLRDPRMWMVALDLWRHPIVHYRSFRIATPRRNDLDAGINANVLFYLGRTPATERVVAFLLRVLREGSEATADTWYPPFALWYFLSRALHHAGEGARALLLERVSSAAARTPLEHALAANVLLDCDTAADVHIAQLLDAQLDSGAWPRGMIYHDEDRGWGSESMTTALCLEALSRWLARMTA